MKPFLSFLILSLTCGLFGSCGNDFPEDSPVGMTWESTLAFTPGKDIAIPAESGVYDFTCKSHGTFGVRNLEEDGKSIPVNLYSTRLHTIRGEWYEIHIGANLMQVSVRRNETGRPRSLLVQVGASGGGMEMRLVQGG